jgi:hypothetical protein
VRFIDLRQLDRADADYVRAHAPRPGIGRLIKDWDNVMSAMTFNDPFEYFRKVLQPGQRPEWLKTGGEQFWRNQDRALDCMENLARGWFERRHAGARAAQDAVVKIFSAEKPLDALQGYQQWMSGAFDRLMADSVAISLLPARRCSSQCRRHWKVRRLQRNWRQRGRRPITKQPEIRISALQV